MDQLDENDFEKEIDETSELKMTIQERIINIELAIKPDSSVSEDDDVIDSARSSSRTSSSKKTKRLIQTVKLPKFVIKKFGGITRNIKGSGIVSTLQFTATKR